MDFLHALIDIQLFDLLDMALVALFVYALLLGLRRVRVRLLARVLLAVAVLYVIAQAFGLRLTVYLFHLSLAAGGLVLVILYRDELRSALDRLLDRMTQPYRPGSAGRRNPATAWVDTLITILEEMARQRIGALVVLRGRDDLARHISGGTKLGGEISEALIRSIFDPHCIGHDGAMVVERGRIAIFQAHLPLSTDAEQLHQRGTRHAAALGLAERTDALCLVVSEERGTISCAQDGELRPVSDAGELQTRIGEFLRSTENGPTAPTPRWPWKRLRPALIAIVVSYLLWFFIVHEGATEYHSYIVPVKFAGVDEGLRVQAVEPTHVQVILSGPRRAFYLVSERHIGVEAPLFERGPGAHAIPLAAPDVYRPGGLSFTNIVPRVVEVRLEPAPPPAAPPE